MEKNHNKCWLFFVVLKRVKGDMNIIAPELWNRLVLGVSQYISHVVSCYTFTKSFCEVNWPWITQIRAIYNPHVTKNIGHLFSLPRDWSLLHIMLSWFHHFPVPAWQRFPLLPVFKVWLGSQWQEDTASDRGLCVKQHWLHLMTTPQLLCKANKD